MKKHILLLLLILTINISAMSQEESGSDFSVSVSTALSFMYGNINEYVFDETGTVSRLDWDIKPLFLVGTKLSVSSGNLQIKSSLFYAVNEDTGSIKDYDWDTSTGGMTNYSKHNVKQKGSVFTDTGISYKYKIDEKLSLIPAAGIMYNNIQLTAEGGYLEYPPGSARDPVYGKGIIYEQKYLIPYIGAGLRYDFGGLALGADFNYTAFLWCVARDSHVKRDIDFYDEIINASYYNINGDITYTVTERVSASVECGWTYIPESKGDSYYIDLSTGEKSLTSYNGGGIRAVYGECSVFINFIF